MNHHIGDNFHGRNDGTEPDAGTDPYRALVLALIDADADFVTGVARALAGTHDDDGGNGVRGHVCGPLCGRPFGRDVSADLDVLRAGADAPSGRSGVATQTSLSCLGCGHVEEGVFCWTCPTCGGVAWATS